MEKMVFKKMILLLVCIMSLACGCSASKTGMDEKKPTEPAASTTPSIILDESDNGVNEIGKPILVEDVVITWVIPELAKSGTIETNVSRLNNKLKEDGYGLTLQIKSYPSRKYREDVIPLLESGKADIVSVGLDMADGSRGYAQDFIREGYLEDLSVYLNSENGYVLKNWYHEDEWKRVETDGRFYVLPSQNNVYSSDYFAFNKKYVTEEMLEGFKGTPGEIDNMISSLILPEGIKEIVGTPAISSLYPLCDVVEEKGVFYNLETGVAENPFLNTEFHQYIQEMNSLYKKGKIHIFEGLEAVDLERQTVRNVNFVVWIGYRKDAFYEEIKDSVHVVPMKQVMVNALSGTSGINRNSQKKEEALRLLTLLYTNETYANLLLFGEEGIDYRRIDGYVCNMAGEAISNNINSFLFGTLDTAYSCKTDLLVVDKNATQDAFFESEYYLNSAILGFQPDCTNFSADMKKALTILNSYSQIWKEEDLETAWARANAEFEAAEGNELVEELNRQVAEWMQETKKE